MNVKFLPKDGSGGTLGDMISPKAKTPTNRKQTHHLELQGIIEEEKEQNNRQRPPTRKNGKRTGRGSLVFKRPGAVPITIKELCAKKNLEKELKIIYWSNGDYDHKFGHLRWELLSKETVSELKDMVKSFDNVFKNKKRNTTNCLIYGMTGLALSFVQRELYWTWIWPNETSQRRVMYIIVNLIRSAVTFTTILLLYNNIKYHNSALNFSLLSKAYLKDGSLLRTLWNSKAFFLETFFSILHEPPFLDVYVDIAIWRIYDPCQDIPLQPAWLHNPWGLFVIFRLYLLIRYIRITYYSGGTQILGIWSNFQFSLPFTIRAVLHSYPFLTLGPILIASTTIGAYFLFVCERTAEHGNIHTYLDALWALCITMTTVGYGDLVPSTWIGRSIVILISLVYMIFSAALIATVHEKLCLMPYESRMVEFLEHANSLKHLRNKGAAVIQAAWRLHVKGKINSKRLPSKETSTKNEMNSVIERITEFDHHRNTVQAHDRRYRNNQLVRSMLEDISRQCEEAKLYFAAANKIASETGISIDFDNGRHSICVEHGNEIWPEKSKELQDKPPYREQLFKINRGKRFGTLPGQINNEVKSNNSLEDRSEQPESISWKLLKELRSLKSEFNDIKKKLN